MYKVYRDKSKGRDFSKQDVGMHMDVVETCDQQ